MADVCMFSDGVCMISDEVTGICVISDGMSGISGILPGLAFNVKGDYWNSKMMSTVSYLLLKLQ